MNPDPAPPMTAPTLDVRANLALYPWEKATPDNTSGGYLIGAGLDHDEIGRPVLAVLVQVAPDHYVIAHTTFNLAAMAVRALAASPIAREAGL